MSDSVNMRHCSDKFADEVGHCEVAVHRSLLQLLPASTARAWVLSSPHLDMHLHVLETLNSSVCMCVCVCVFACARVGTHGAKRRCMDKLEALVVVVKVPPSRRLRLCDGLSASTVAVLLAEHLIQQK